jgi:hypothetical protein
LHAFRNQFRVYQEEIDDMVATYDPRAIQAAEILIVPVAQKNIMKKKAME